MQLGPVLNERQPIAKNVFFLQLHRKTLQKLHLEITVRHLLEEEEDFLTFIQTKVQKHALFFANLLESKFYGKRDLCLFHSWLPWTVHDLQHAIKK